MVEGPEERGINELKRPAPLSDKVEGSCSLRIRLCFVEFAQSSILRVPDHNYNPQHYTRMSAETPAELVQLDNFHDIFGLRGKVAVITGGSRGLGLYTASGRVEPILK